MEFWQRWFYCQKNADLEEFCRATIHVERDFVARQTGTIAFFPINTLPFLLSSPHLTFFLIFSRKKHVFLSVKCRLLVYPSSGSVNLF